MDDVGSGVATGAAIGTQIMPGWGTAIGAVAGGIGGILTSSAKRKAEERKLQQQKAMNRVTIEQQKAEAQDSLLKNLAANLANTIKQGM